MGLYVGGYKIDPVKRRVYVEAIAPGTPTSGRGYVYEKTDGKLYLKNDAGTEYDLTATGGGTGAGVSREEIVLKTLTGNSTLTLHSFNKGFVFNKISDGWIQLPPTLGHEGKRLLIMKGHPAASGVTMTIRRAGTDTIMNKGNRIRSGVSVESGQAFLWMRVAPTGNWICNGMGTWELIK